MEELSSTEAKDYIVQREIPLLFESMLTGLMFHRPQDPMDFLEGCLSRVREIGGVEKVRWDTFITTDKKALPPAGQRAQLRSQSSSAVLPRGDRQLGHQLSIESDTDLSETDELIAEYVIFDPQKPRPRIILIIGGPASGKGTQSLKTAERYGFVYISVGEVLRQKMIHSASSNRKWGLIAKIITNGELAPQETTINEIKQQLMQNSDAKGFVIDGFPRDVAQAICFDDQICQPDLVLFLSCGASKLKERLEKREQQGRPDNNPKAIARRLATFKQNAMPLVSYYQDKEVIVKLDASRDEEQVFQDICVIVDHRLFPAKEPAEGASELDLSMIAENGSDSDETDDEAEHDCMTCPPETAEDKLHRVHVIFMFGGPGSGKNTQCQRIAARYGYPHLAVGELLKLEVASRSLTGQKIKELMERGDTVPKEIVVAQLRDAMLRSLPSTKGFVISGFPTDEGDGQREEFEKVVASPEVVLLLECSSETMADRLYIRSLVSQHHQDEASIRMSTEACKKKLEPTIAAYEKRGLVHRVCAEGTPEETFKQVCTVLDTNGSF
ncbi:adenylate kinase isoenzyme 5-like isoform X1 [Polypterus senegalus]|uniref:adenylate kinase isoenzyme 5-like isoform X1 n=1 Tax=Polypterus senegalus TaxID=55291 RepID=UPI0019662BE6|nr:adenylate kinase isoenzyme 5-like isoform X1 [Polypterus senegalus]